MIGQKRTDPSMQTILAWIIVLFVAMAGSSCKKELSCESCPAENSAPIAVAGSDQTIVLPLDSVLLDGTGSRDPDGSIKIYRWREIAGASPAQIVNSADSVTRVRALLVGQYQFELVVTDNGGSSSRDTVQVTVRAAAYQNRPPVACAGPDQNISLPVNSVTLDGRCSADPDNDIAAYQWTKLSGPASFRIANPDQALTTLTDLVEGSFEFQLTVRDATGFMSADTVRILVNPLPVIEDGVEIYVAGNENSAPKYWKNGQGVDLKISHNTNGHATDIAVYGDDVYVTGWEGDYLDMRNNLAKYWKNGQEVFLTGATGAGANAITVSGNDVFVAGWELKSQPGISVAKYWKNGVAVSLTDGSKTADATDIAVLGGDVYVSGYDGDVARVWRNGQLIWSEMAADPSYAFGLAISGSDIYLGGVMKGKAVYWKNGEVFPLSMNESSGQSIFVSGTDIYVSGAKGRYGNTVAVYWKNGQETILSGAGEAMVSTDILVENNNVYVTGLEYISNYRGGYWRNGQFVQVGPPRTTQPSSILVKRR